MKYSTFVSLIAFTNCYFGNGGFGGNFLMSPDDSLDGISADSSNPLKTGKDNTTGTPPFDPGMDFTDSDPFGDDTSLFDEGSGSQTFLRTGNSSILPTQLVLLCRRLSVHSIPLGFV
jgi:hypothetical protein